MLCWARIWLCWAHCAGLGVGFGPYVALGWGVGGRAGLGWARTWLSVYGLHCTCLLHVFMMSLCQKFSECFSWIERLKKSQTASLLWVLLDLIDLLGLFGVYAGIIVFHTYCDVGNHKRCTWAMPSNDGTPRWHPATALLHPLIGTMCD